MDNQTLTFEEAKKLRPGTILNHSEYTNADGTPARFKVTSVKTWKRQPNRISIRLKRGIYGHYKWDESHFTFAVITVQYKAKAWEAVK